MPTSNIRPLNWLLLPLLAACTLPAAAAFAGEASVSAQSKDKNVTQDVLDVITPLNTLSIESSYVGDTGFKIKHFDGTGAQSQRPYKHQDEVEESIEYGHRFHLTGNLYLKLGADYQRFDFGRTSAPLPTSLQNISGLVAVEYVTQGKAAAFISSKPGVYYSDFDKISKGAFDAPTVVASVIPLNKKFYFLAGARFSILARYPVLPIGGAIWYISDRVTLELVPPEPRLIVSLGKNVDVFLGGELLGEAYKRDSDPNARQQDRRFNGGVVDFSEYRLGGGLTYKPIKAVGIDVSGGWDLGKDFDYYRGDSKRFETHGAPYVKIEISAAF